MTRLPDEVWQQRLNTAAAMFDLTSDGEAHERRSAHLLYLDPSRRLVVRRHDDHARYRHEMTRDEQRNACIEAIEHVIEDGRPFSDFVTLATAAFDALNGIAFVCPIEATAPWPPLAISQINGENRDTT